jgi:D-cysteine desulfhydrase/L-cysteate sulfo-lyase
MPGQSKHSSTLPYPDRYPLIHAPTSIEPLTRLGEQLGSRALWVKRDDCTGLALGGNKARKLEFLLADALAQGADMLITVGGVQSNHCRQTAAAAARAGLACELLLQSVPGAPANHYAECGNVLLDRLLGADSHWLAASADCDIALAARAEMHRAVGRNPYAIPVGGSNALGALGYVRCAEELLDQLDASGQSLDRIVLASGSAGTQAGLIAGLAARGSDIEVIGFCVSRSGHEQAEKVYALLLKVCAVLDIDAPPRERVRCDGGYVGEGYGVATDDMRTAVQLTARSEGLLLDPVYTGKAMAGLIDYLRRGVIGADERVLFLHTGGTPGLFAYTEALY